MVSKIVANISDGLLKRKKKEASLKNFFDIKP
jgi:hypothetical protein